MKSIIRNILNEEVENKNPLKKSEIYLFKYLNKNRNEAKTKDALIDMIKSLLSSMSIDTGKAKYYYELYLANYREAGDYENITIDDFKGPDYFIPTNTPNNKARDFTKGKLPFRGSNTKGTWEVDNLNVPYYIVTSYNWYPIYLYKENHWYEAIDRYSSTTGKQMNALNPVKYSDELKDRVVLVTTEEMNSLKRNSTYDDIIRGKFNSLVKNRESLISNKTKNISAGYGENPNDDNRAIKIKFKVTNAEEVDGLFVITVLVDDAGFKSGQALVPSQGGYLRNEHPNLTKERVEKGIRNEIIPNLKKYLPKNIYYHEELPEDYKIRFEFKHLHEK
jgi:hypothetical protein